MRLHKLKTWPEFFKAVAQDVKTFEIRENDRGFNVGDFLLLEEFDPTHQEYTGATCFRLITYMTEWEQRQGFVVMAIKPVSITP